jgi:hypothetical protein
VAVADQSNAVEIKVGINFWASGRKYLFGEGPACLNMISHATNATKMTNHPWTIGAQGVIIIGELADLHHSL